MKNTVGTLLIIILLGGCLRNDPLNLPFDTFKPKENGDGLTLSYPSAEKIDSTALLNIYKSTHSDKNLWSIRSLLVFRNGRLISEAYFKDEQDIMERHLIWSCTKQVIGVLVGIAYENGFINDIDDSISEYFDTELNSHPDKASITIRNLITMQSGIDYSNDGPTGETDKILRQIPDNSVDFILSRPVNATQGTIFHYNDGNPHLISAILQKVTGKPTDVWADEVLFSRIEMTNYNWARYKDGITLGGFGIETTPRELAKIALCVADGGRWKGQQVIHSNWINDMLTAHIEVEDSNYSFGYFWWIDNNRNIKFMLGHGGQFAFIVPDKNLLVVMTSIPNTQGDYEINADEALPIVDRIINATY
jgi:CubicO group peptidase (beta-lactamase class C family)